MSDEKYIEVDYAFRRRFIIECFMLLAFGLLMILCVYPRYFKPLVALYPVYSFWIIEVLIISILTIMALSWSYMLKTGYLTIQQKQYPPEKTQVLKRTLIIQEDAAIKAGKCLMIFSSICILACIGFAIWIAQYGLRIVTG